jgi:hypothetical protein
MIVEAPQRASRPGRSPIYSQPKAETRAFAGRGSVTLDRDGPQRPRPPVRGHRARRDLVRGELQIDSQRTPRMRSPDRRSFLEPMSDLEHRWLEVLAAAAGALDSASRAGLIAAEESRVHSGRIAFERTWLETVDWRSLRSSPGTVTVLEAATVSSRLDLARRAA